MKDKQACVHTTLSSFCVLIGAHYFVTV